MLKERGFRVRGRTFNCETADGLIEVVQFQMGRFDPPGTYYIPGMRENLYGRFTVNLGVYVPEVALYGGIEAGSFVQEDYCCVREGLGRLEPPHMNVWWDLHRIEEAASAVGQRLERDAFPFFARFESRDAILKEWMPLSKSSYSNRPRIECAIILATRGQRAEALALLSAQAQDVGRTRHTEYLRDLARKLGLRELEV